jgi:non-ribosomal peptide synthetase component F
MKAQSLWGLVRDAAGRVPSSKTAIWNADASCTYGELISRAQGIAASLHEAGVGRGDRVGIWMDKTPNCVQAILGTMAAGAAYVPLDPRAPWRRCRTIAEDCGFAAIIADQPRLASLGEFLQGLSPRKVIVEAAEDAITAAHLPPDLALESFASAVARKSVPLPEVHPEDLAYILYTSGSTGTPKGVIHTHLSGLAFTKWVQDRFAITPDDIFSSHAPFHFDLSISDLYASLGSGASLRLISSLEGMLAAHLVKLITETKMTVW